MIAEKCPFCGRLMLAPIRAEVRHECDMITSAGKPVVFLFTRDGMTRLEEAPCNEK